MGRHGLRGAWVALAVAATLTAPAAASPILHAVIEDGGAGSTACINVVSLRYYLCVRADGSTYRIHY